MTEEFEGACRHCGRPSPRELCEPDAERLHGILANVHLWALELRATASGIRGIDYARAAQRRPTQVSRPGPVDDARIALADQLDGALRDWTRVARTDGVRLVGATFGELADWPRAGECMRAMVHAEQRALSILDPDGYQAGEYLRLNAVETALRAQRARQGRPGARPPVAKLAAIFDQIRSTPKLRPNG